MKPKNLIPLVIILAILVALVVYRQATTRTPGIVEQVGLVKLLPDGLSKSDVVKIELYAGEKPADKLVLAFDAAADKWRVTTDFNAPVKKDTIDKYLDALVKLKGEPRATASAESDLAQYNLTDAKAFHLVGYTKDATEPLMHFLIGKAPNYKTVFIRKAGDNAVFVEETNLRQMAGVYDDTPPPKMGKKSEEKEEPKEVKKPEPGTWLDKEVVKIDTAKVTKLALTLPDKSLVFERREKPKAAAPAAAATPDASASSSKPSGSSEEEQGEATPPAAPVASGSAEKPKPEYEWVLVSGGPGAPLKPKGIESLLQKFTSLNANDIVDPAKKSDWGLATPGYVCVLSIEGQPDVRIEGGRPNTTGDGYVRVADAKDDLVYTLSKYTFEQIFPKGTDLFDLPNLTLDKKTIQSIDLASPQGRILLTKNGETWAITTPAADFKPQTTTLDTIASTLAAWKPVDYADSNPQLGEPTRAAKVAVGGQTRTLNLYTDAKHIDGVYARLDDGKELLVMSRTDFNKVFVPAKDLYERTLNDIQERDIAEIVGKSPAGGFILVRQEGDWKLTTNGATVDGDKETCDKVAETIASLQVTDILFGRKNLDGGAESTLHVKTSEKGEHIYTFSPEKDGSNQAQRSGKAQVFTVAHSTVTELFPAVDKLKKPAPPAPAPAPTPAPAEGTGGTAAAPEAPAPVATPAPAGGTGAAPTPAPATVQVIPTPPPAAAPVIVTPSPPEPAPAPTPGPLPSAAAPVAPTPPPPEGGAAK